MKRNKRKGFDGNDIGPGYDVGHAHGADYGNSTSVTGSEGAGKPMLLTGVNSTLNITQCLCCGQPLTISLLLS